MIDFGAAAAIIISTLIGYIFGALPIAAWVSRRRGVDIFSVGTGLPGASNVRRQVGKAPGGLVLVGDMAKGAIAVIAAGRMGVEGLWLLAPCFAIVVGHWRSIFTGFRGGDGLSPLGGAILVMFPPFTGFVAVAVGSLVMLGGQRLPYSSLLGVVVAVAALIGFTMSGAFGESHEPAMAAGIGVIAGLVLVHASLGHYRRNSEDEGGVEEGDEDDAEGATG